jgi:hypothetical protein
MAILASTADGVLPACLFTGGGIAATNNTLNNRVADEDLRPMSRKTPKSARISTWKGRDIH